MCSVVLILLLILKWHSLRFSFLVSDTNYRIIDPFKIEKMLYLSSDEDSWDDEETTLDFDDSSTVKKISDDSNKYSFETLSPSQIPDYMDTCTKSINNIVSEVSSCFRSHNTL